MTDEERIGVEVLTKVRKSIKYAIDNYNPHYTDTYNVVTELSDIVIGRIDLFLERMKKR